MSMYTHVQVAIDKAVEEAGTDRMSVVVLTPGGRWLDLAAVPATVTYMRDGDERFPVLVFHAAEME